MRLGDNTHNDAPFTGLFGWFFKVIPSNGSSISSSRNFF